MLFFIFKIFSYFCYLLSIPSCYFKPNTLVVKRENFTVAVSTTAIAREENRMFINMMWKMKNEMEFVLHTEEEIKEEDEKLHELQEKKEIFFPSRSKSQRKKKLRAKRKNLRWKKIFFSWKICEKSGLN